MKETNAVYQDLITGEIVRVKIRGDGHTPAERFWVESNYRKSDERSEDRCEFCKLRCFNVKCEKVGYTDSTATNIELDHVCNYFKR